MIHTPTTCCDNPTGFHTESAGPQFYSSQLSCFTPLHPEHASSSDGGWRCSGLISLLMNSNPNGVDDISNTLRTQTGTHRWCSHPSRCPADNGCVRLHEERILWMRFLQVGNAGGQDDERSKEVWSRVDRMWRFGNNIFRFVHVRKRVRF